MPDLAPLRAYERELLDLERAAQRASQAVADNLRRQLLDVLDARGLRSLTLGSSSVVAQARRQLVRELGTIAGQIQEQAIGFARDDLAAVTAAAGDPSVGDNAPLDLAPLLSAAVEQTSSWLIGAQGLLAAEALQLQATGAPPELARARLFSTTPGERIGVWGSAAGQISLATSQLAWSLANASRLAVYAATAPGPRYQRQAIAALDGRTTLCCLRVHGQIVGIDEPFVLTGTPRFAGRLMAPPFHWRCRTSVVLYHTAMEAIGTSTAEMRQQARDELARRGQERSS